MANVRISNLPVANRLWNLEELIPVVNSGNTTTSKRDYKSLFSNHSGGTYNITASDQTWAVIASASDSPATTINIGGINNAAVIASRGANITSGQMNTIIGCEQNSNSDQPTINGGQYNSIIASKGGVSTSGNYGFIAAAANGQIQGGNNNALIATQGFNLGGNSQKVVGMAVEAGGWNGPRYAFAAAGYQLTTTGSDNGNQKAGIAFNGLTFDGGGSNKYYNAGIAVLNGTVSHDGAALIASSGRTTLYDYTIHTDNMHVYKTRTSNVIAGGNVGGTVDIDCRDGEVFTFTLTANTTPNFTNLKTGQKLEFIVTNTTFSVPDAQIDGVTGNVLAKGGTIAPSNNAVSFYSALYDGTYLILIEENGLSAV